MCYYDHGDARYRVDDDEKHLKKLNTAMNCFGKWVDDDS